MAIFAPRGFRIQSLLYWVVFIFQTSVAQADLPTVTVRGFLNFQTTVDGTVIVFTPAASEAISRPSIPVSAVPRDTFLEKVLNSQEGMHAEVPRNSLGTIQNPIPDKNQMKDSFLKHISDNAVLPSMRHVNNEIRKLQSSQNQYPTGLVTVLGGTFVDGLSTTIYETKVIGTYIDGKYAQILQSTSHIAMPPSAVAPPALSYLTVERTQNREIRQFSNGILKDGLFSSVDFFFITSQAIKPKSSPFSSKSEISPISLKPIESTPAVSLETVRATTRNPFSEKESSRGMKGQSNNIKLKSSDFSSKIEISSLSLKSIQFTPVVTLEAVRATTRNPFSEKVSSQGMKVQSNNIKLKSSPFSSKVEISPLSLKSIESTPVVSLEAVSATTRNPLSEKESSQGIKVQSNNIRDNMPSRISVKQGEIKSSSAALQSSFAALQISQNRYPDMPTDTLESAFKSSSNKKLSTFMPVSFTLVRLPDDDNTLDLTKTPRNSTSRTRFLSPRRPSQTVRLNRFKVKLTLRQDSPDEYNVTLHADEEDLEEDIAHKDEEDMEDVTEGMGILVDLASVVFQETTITSEVTLHVGRRKSVRTLTITTSIPLTVNPTDIQEILSSQSTAMDISNNDHHIVTRTFTTTERALQTSVVPIFDGQSTMYHTVTESFFIMKLITAYRTLPPGDSSVLESYLDESEIAATDIEANSMQTSVIQSEEIAAEDTLQSSISTQPQIANRLLSLGHALSTNPLAAVYFGLQQFNAHMTLYSTVTDVSTYVTTETMYRTKTIPLYDGRSTRYRIISEPISINKSTVTTTRTSVQPFFNTHAIQQQQQLQKLIAETQLSPPQPQFNTVTSTYTTVTTATLLSTRIYTLIYNGFSTKFRTVTSSTLYPTTVTVTSTAKLLIAPTPVNLPFTYPYTS